MELWFILAIAATVAVAVANVWAPLVRWRTKAALRRHVDAPAAAIEPAGRTLSKPEFYNGKVVVETVWYLHHPDLPDTFTWARLRVFDDGTADATFSAHDIAYGFEGQSFASGILTEDEYVCFSTANEEDAQEWNIRLADVSLPTWIDDPNKPFRYLGTY